MPEPVIGPRLARTRWANAVSRIMWTSGACRLFLDDRHFSGAMRTGSHLPFAIRAIITGDAQGERVVGF